MTDPAGQGEHLPERRTPAGTAALLEALGMSKEPKKIARAASNTASPATAGAGSEAVINWRRFGVMSTAGEDEESWAGSGGCLHNR